jgi:hypothetical protein
MRVSQLLLPLPRTTDWITAIPTGTGRSPYYVMGRQVQFAQTKVPRTWFEGMYYKHSQHLVRVGAGHWFTRITAPKQVYFCCGVVLKHNGRLPWSVIGVESEFTRSCQLTCHELNMCQDAGTICIPGA